MENNIAHSQLTNNWKHLQNDYGHVTLRIETSQKSSAVSGGYEYDFVDDPIPERFQCSICTKVLRDARLTDCCGQHYCDSCLTKWLKKQKTCPHCRKENFQSIINKEKIREVNELCIRCSNREKGCDWVGEMGVLEDHLKSDKGCGYEIVKCDDILCGERMEKRHLTNHKENECKYRPYTCEYCGHKGTFESIAMRYKMQKKQIEEFVQSMPQWYKTVFFHEKKLYSHYDHCAEYPLECPNKCGVIDIKRKDMEEHCDICPLEPLDCPFNAGDCSKDILRKDMESHKRQCGYQPYSCGYCGHRGTFRDITGIRLRGLTVVAIALDSHYGNCDQYPLECPNECGETNIKRRDMKVHHDICPLEPLDCPFKDVGCTDKIQRKDMEKHIESSTQQHLLKTHQKMMKAYQQLKKLKKSYRKLKERMEDLEQDTSLSDTSESECDDFL